MPNSRDFIEHVLDLARGAGRPEARAMFGGHGIYLDGIIVAIVIDDALYLKSDEHNAAAFDARATAVRLRYQGGRAHRHELPAGAPDESLEGPAQMREWIQLAHGAALRAAVRKPGKKRSRAVAKPKGG